MKNIRAIWLLSGLSLLGLGGLTACDEGPAEDMGESIDDAADDAKDSAEEAADELEDAVDDVNDGH